MGLFSWLRRAPAPAARRRVRSFDSAKISRLYSSSTMPRPPDVDIRNGLRALVARSRHEAQNNDYARQYLRLVRTNVIGHQGITLQARVQDPDGTTDALANDAIEAAWADWSRMGVPDITGQHSLKTLLRVAVDTLVRDGEILIRKHIGGRDNPYGTVLELLDPQVLDVDLNHNPRGGNVIRMGVELSPQRRPVAYHLLTSSNTADTYVLYGRRYTRVPAEQIYHCYLHESAWQTRGVPSMAALLMRMNMLEGYEEAALVNARSGASKMGFFTTPDGVSGIGEEQDDGEMLTSAEPGTFEDLPPGVEFQPYNPDYPNGEFEGFVKGALRGIAAGLGVSYHTLSSDLSGANYSSLRQGALEDRAVWMMLQDWLIESLLDPMYRDWLQAALFAGAITVLGKPLKSDRIDKYTRVSWQPRRWQWVDPAKEMAAAETAVNNRFRSISDIIREQGRDPETVWAEIARERARLQALGITPEQALAATSKPDSSGSTTP